MSRTPSNAMEDALDLGMSGLPNTNDLLSISQPPEFILKILIIQSRDNIKGAMEKYFSQQAQNIKPDTSRLKARIIGLFLEIRNSFKEHYENDKSPGKKSFEAFEKELLDTKDFKTLYDINTMLNDFLYKKKLIKFDNRAVYNTGRPEEENKIHHL